MQDKIEQLIVKTIDDNAEKLKLWGKDIYKNAEPGFKEIRTAKKVADFLETIGLSTRTGIARTGVSAEINMGKTVTIGLIGELDGIACATHPDANLENGMAHACGHNLQLTGMMGAALALSHPEVAKALGGNIRFMAIPAEEYIGNEASVQLVAEKQVRYGIGGKNEWIVAGEFEGVDLVLTHHVHMTDAKVDVLMGNNSCNGFITKNITLTGKAAHAAISPEQGVNALNAATLGMSAVAYLRETFKDEDHVRVHGIITKGGAVSNVVPDEVVIDMQVRAGSLKAMQDASEKVDRAFEGTALALGAICKIKSTAGYFPIIRRPADDVMLGMEALLGEGITVSGIDDKTHNSASTDVGDLTHLMPVLNFTTSGTKGALHSKEYEIIDDYKAYILPAKVMALMTYRLLKNEAKEAKTIKSKFKPTLTVKQYSEQMKNGRT